MMLEAGNYLLNFLTALLQDVRFLVAFGFFVLIQWVWRLPRPRKEARNKTVFITGCDTGMGHRMAKRFDEIGMHVFAGCLLPDGNGAQKLKESCSDRLHIVPLDITKDDQIQQAVAYVKANLPPKDKGLYCLVNNAGILGYTDFELMTLEMCDEIMAVNLSGTIRVTKHFMPLISQTPGRIVTITSILARLVHPRVAVYAATKHALNGFFSTLRYELAEKRIHIAMVEPGDFSSVTDIKQWTQRHLEDIWNNLSPEEKISKRHLFERTKKRTSIQTPATEQENNFKILLDDVEDAMLAEEPHWRYVSAPLVTKIALWVFRSLPESWTYQLMGAI